MKIYNTLTRQKEEFKPLEENKVKMYVCGPTVYNYIHIGNARPYIVFDAVRRYFEYKGYDVNYVQNFTDVDDKIIKKAIEEGITAKEVAERYIEETLKDADAFNIKRATKHPRVTEVIDDIVAMIADLVEKGAAYEVNGTVYYNTQSFNEYGKLSGKNQEDLEAGARIAVNEDKRHPMDFVLWKPKKEGEPAWKSPWSEGRPGWHIECSVMAKRYLGEEIDIHAGGEDLVFPHHENEIAQSEASNGKPFARYWMHNRFLNIENRKMSKSKGNFFTARQVAEEFGHDAVRMFMLSAHYRSPINFSRDLMEAASNSLERIQTGVFNIKYKMENSEGDQMTADELSKMTTMKDYVKKFEAAMEDDFNTADAIAVIFEMIRFSNTAISEDVTKAFATALFNEITNLAAVLGLEVVKEEELLDQEIEALIEERQQARKDRNFARADEIRDTLNAKGIVLEDTREGVRFKRV